MTDDLQPIGKVARELGLTLRAIRFYEDKGLIAPARRGTTRLFDTATIARLRLIKRWTAAGLPLVDTKTALLYVERGQAQALYGFMRARLTVERGRAAARFAAIDGVLGEEA